MTEDNIEEPTDLKDPDPRAILLQRLSQVKFHANGRSHPSYVRRVEEALIDGEMIYRMMDQPNTAYRELSPGQYEHLQCGTILEVARVSRGIKPLNSSTQRQIWSQPYYYCPKCESPPKERDLTEISEKDWPGYKLEEKTKRSPQQTI